MKAAAPALAAALALAACAALPPSVDSAETAGARDAPYPALVPVEPILALADAPGATEADTAAVEARAARLRARAAALRRPAAPQARPGAIAQPAAIR